MEYKYITRDNLEERQSYMYTQYGGADFLAAYYQTRKPFLVKRPHDLTQMLQNVLKKLEQEETRTSAQMVELLRSFDRGQVDLFVKRFEVSKRLFAEYDLETGKAVVSSDYHDIRPYIVLSALAERAYSEFGSLKYLNCLLKVNDTLLSQVSKVNGELRDLFKLLISREVGHVLELAHSKGIAFREE